MLHAFLLPVHASLEPKETVSYYTLPAVKIILDWLLQDPQLLQHEALSKNPQYVLINILLMLKFLAGQSTILWK